MTLSFIVSGRDRATDRAVHVRVVMVPTQTTKDERGLVVTYNVKYRMLSRIVYWFMIRVLKYRTA